MPRTETETPGLIQYSRASEKQEKKGWCSSIWYRCCPSKKTLKKTAATLSILSGLGMMGDMTYKAWPDITDGNLPNWDLESWAFLAAGFAFFVGGCWYLCCCNSEPQQNEDYRVLEEGIRPTHKDSISSETGKMRQLRKNNAEAKAGAEAPPAGSYGEPLSSKSRFDQLPSDFNSEWLAKYT